MRCIGDNFPSKLVPKILETALANPEVIILRGIPLVQCIGMILDHELRPAECAMIVIPGSVCGIPTIWAVNESHASEVFLLSAESPVRGFCHMRV